MAMQCASLRGVALFKVKPLGKHILFDKRYKKLMDCATSSL